MTQESTARSEPGPDAASAPVHISVDGLRTYYDDEGLSLRDPVRAVDGVSFDIARGETLGLVGESGCGKTTLGRTLLGLEDATDGRVLANGHDVAKLSGRELRAWQREAGMVFQDPGESINDRLTVGEIVREPLSAHDWPQLSVGVAEPATAVAAEGWATTADSPDEADVVLADDAVRVSPRLPLSAGAVTVTRTDSTRTVRVRLGVDGRGTLAALRRGPDAIAEPDATGVAEATVRVADSTFPVRVDTGARTVHVDEQEVDARFDGAERVRFDVPVAHLDLEVARGRAELQRERVFSLLDRVGLQRDHYYRYPHQFSGGQRQRIGIARALALDPEFVVLDEPVSALDVSVQARIVNLLTDLQEDLGLTYLFITHDLSVVRHIADRVAVMYLGRIVERGPTGAVFDDPSHPYTVSLLSAIPGRTARAATGVDRDRITLRGSPPSPRDPPPGCRFATRCPAKIRPEGIDMAEGSWQAVDEFRGLLRRRARGETGLARTALRRLGLTEDDSVYEAVAELFDDRELPRAVRETVDAAAALAAAGRNDEAVARLERELGSVCDREDPPCADVAPGHRSRCLRNGPEYEDVEPVLDRRLSD